MNEVDFIKRLEQELSSGRRWRDVEQVVSATTDSSLGANELLIFPLQPPCDDRRAEALRIIAEHLILPPSA